MAYITSIREARNVVVELLQENIQELGIGYIGQDNERRLPAYPAVVVSVGTKSKEFHSTHTFLVRLTCVIWVYHAKLDVGHRVRSDEDIQLTERIEDLLTSDITFGGQFISHYVSDVVPGMFQPAAAKGDMVIGSRMEWVALSQQRFK